MKIFQKQGTADQYGVVPGLAGFARDAQETAHGISDEFLLSCNDNSTARGKLINFAKVLNDAADLLLNPNK